MAIAGGIEELLKLGEGISGSVSKCRLRKSGQIFAIKATFVFGKRMLIVDNYYRSCLSRAPGTGTKT